MRLSLRVRLRLRQVHKAKLFKLFKHKKYKKH